jgi:hypothetical protein
VVGVFSLSSRRFEPLTLSGAATFWLNDNRRLLFRQDEKIFLVDIQTQKYHEALNQFPHKVLQAVLSRDNQWLYYSLEQTEADIWLMQPTL